MPFSPEAGRVLGCLVEKQLTTPQQYPLTLHALAAAANQATNRDPVVDLGEDEVLAALDELRTSHLIRVVLPSHGRSVKRYRHVLDEVYGLVAARYGLLAVLLLRGPQTVGELRARTERMVELSSVGDVQAELAALADHADGLVRLQPRRPGQKEDRWQQILAAPWSPVSEPVGSGGGTLRQTDASDEDLRGDGDLRDDRAIHHRQSDAESGPSNRSDGLESLSDEVAAVRAALAVLRTEFDDLKSGLGG